MRKIAIDNIEDGMVLAKPLMGSTGNILLGEGIELKQAMISRFKNWDISFVFIHSDGDEPDDPNAAPVVAISSDQLDEVFKDVLKNPIMRIIYDAARDYNKSRETSL